MQKSHYSKKEKVGWILISLLPLGIIVALLGEPIGKLLSMIGFSQTLSNDIGEIVNNTGCIIMLLGFFSAPIGIIKVIRALRTEKNLNVNIERREIDKNKNEKFKIMLIRGSTIGTPIIYITTIIFLLSSYTIKERIIPIILVTVICISIFIIGIKYSNYFKKQKENEGKIYTPSLDLLYEGKIKNGSANGKGTVYFYDGTKRGEGNFKDGLLNGEGTTYYTDGNVRYRGRFKDGLANGKGTIYYQNGNIAGQGTFKNDKLEGKGISCYTSGNIRYKGNFKNGLANGKGTIYYPSGNVASQGTFKNDKLEGMGISYYDNGNKHQEGTFINGKLENFGKIFYVTGDLLYEGEFKSGLPHGKGIMYDANGYEIHKGKFKKGKIWDLSKRLQILLYKLLFWKK